MTKEIIQPEQSPKKLSPEKFSQVCDSLVDYQIPSTLFGYVNEAAENKRLIVFLLTHQSYFDLEACRHICEDINQTAKDPIDSYLEYSSPAVGKNIGDLLAERKEVYDKCHLNLLGVVRGPDKIHEKYKKLVTEELIKESKKNHDLYNEKTNLGGCISFIPFEATLHSGRINSETGNINGMKEVTDNLLLIQAIRQKAIIIPCGIDGSYRIVDPENHTLSALFYDAIFNRNHQKVVTLKTGQPIDLLLPEYQQIPTRMLYKKATIAVASLVSSQAQGEYRKYLVA